MERRAPQSLVTAAKGAAQLLRQVTKLRPGYRDAKLLMADTLAIVGERTFNGPARNCTISSSNRYRREACEGG